MLYMVACCCSDDVRRGRFDEIVKGLARDGRQMQAGLWIIEAGQPATELRDRISRQLDGCNSVIVTLLAGHAAWSGFDQSTQDWLLANL